MAWIDSTTKEEASRLKSSRKRHSGTQLSLLLPNPRELPHSEVARGQAKGQAAFRKEASGS
jgi:hypothetical protein